MVLKYKIVVSNLLFECHSHQALIMYWLVADGGHAKFSSKEFDV
jgi:hypothetical protein